MSLLLARRLVEAGVPFVSVFWMEDPKLDPSCKSGGGWDTHGNNFGCLQDHLLAGVRPLLFRPAGRPARPRPAGSRRWCWSRARWAGSREVGDPRSGGATGGGRDHWTHCMSVLLAGGGIRGGQVYGASDKIAAYPADKPVAPEDVARTVYHALGISDNTGTDREGRPFEVLPEGRALTELF